MYPYAKWSSLYPGQIPGTTQGDLGNLYPTVVPLESRRYLGSLVEGPTDTVLNRILFRNIKT